MMGWNNITDKYKAWPRRPYRKGDRVRNRFTGETFTVKVDAYWQDYAGGDTADYTVEMEATADQPTPWDKSRNLEPVDCEGGAS